MKSHNLKMDEMLNFSPDEGRIYLKGTRVLIENADAMGTLRKDLISTLGFERAKGFLVRYGWACGFNDALSIKEQFDWDDDLEWIKSGPVLHSLEGIGRNDIEIIKINRKEKEWLVKGKLINSFEAEQHLRFFGTHDSPVCWTYIGYAGGYGSAYLGERVIYKETKCVGKGDPYCEFIGKTLEKWGDEINSELLYYEEQKINEELEAANRRIQQQHLQLQRAFDIQEQLTNLILSGEGLRGITKTLADIINGTVMVFDNKHHTLVSYTCDEIPNSNLLNKIIEFLNNLNCFSTDIQEYNELIANKKPLWVDFQIGKEIYPCVYVPIVVKKDLLGFITAIPRDKTKQDVIIAIQNSASVYALELIKQKTIVDLEQQFRGDFLDNLLLNSSPDISALKAWAIRLGHDISIPHNVMAMGVDSKKMIMNQAEKIKSNNDLFEDIHIFTRTCYPSILCGQLKDTIIFLFPFEEDIERKKIHDFIAQLRQEIIMHFPQISVYLGVGRVISEVTDFSNSYCQAIRALDIVRMFKKNDTAVFYEDLGSLALLLDSNNKKELLDFMLKKLGPLLEYDKKFNSELLKTLEQYLDNKNMLKTSKESALSISGLKYRLSKIKELGYDLQSQQERFDLRIALNIWKIKQMNSIT